MGIDRAELPDSLAFLAGCINGYTSKDTMIYFLTRGGVVVYVGRTDNIKQRTQCHKKTKDFDGIFYLHITRKVSKIAEAAFIGFYKPEYNIMMPHVGREKKIRKIVGKIAMNNHDIFYQEPFAFK